MCTCSCYTHFFIKDCPGVNGHQKMQEDDETTASQLYDLLASKNVPLSLSFDVEHSWAGHSEVVLTVS